MQMLIKKATPIKLTEPATERGNGFRISGENDATERKKEMNVKIVMGETSAMVEELGQAQPPAEGEIEVGEAEDERIHTINGTVAADGSRAGKRVELSRKQQCCIF